MVIIRRKAPYISNCTDEWAETLYKEFVDFNKTGRYSKSVSTSLLLYVIVVLQQYSEFMSKVLLIYF